MRVEIDPSSLEEQLRSQDVAKEFTHELARRWYVTSEDLLIERGGNWGSWGGASETAEVQSVVQSNMPPEWDEARQAWVFTYTHEFAEGFEWGTEPHTIEPVNADYLKFPWPDAPDDIRERFEKQWRDPEHFLEEPEVLLRKVEHPGTPALRYVRDSRDVVVGEFQ